MNSYGYDAGGNRTVKQSGGSMHLHVDSEHTAGATATEGFSLYVGPWMTVNQDRRYTKHIYAGSQRIVSKVGDVSSFSSSTDDPRGVPYVGKDEATRVDSIGTRAKYAVQTARVGGLYAKFGVPYGGRDNNVYPDEVPEPAPERSAGSLPAWETGRFFHHPDHLGSSSRVTDRNGKVVQAVEYVPFGEVFLDLRDSDWSTPYLFNAKELDGETGLYYYGARYYDPRLCLWLSTDPLGELYPSFTCYGFTNCNPLRFIDPTGMVVIAVDEQSQVNILHTLSIAEAKYVNFINGILDKDLLNKSKSKSENIISLKALSNSDILYIFATGSEYYSQGERNDLVAADKSGTKGVTMIPDAKKDPSPNENVYIITSKFLSQEQQASNTAHEGYGHAYYYELKHQGYDVNPYHQYNPILLPPELDPETGVEITPFGREDSNLSLKKHIQIVEKQAVSNYNSHKR